MPDEKGILITALDYDGCVSPRIEQPTNLRTQLPIELFAKYNAVFFEFLNERKTQYNRFIVMVASLRQDFHIDKRNWINGNGSCFPAFQSIAAYLGAEFDKLLLADITNGLPPGTAFSQAILATDPIVTHKYSGAREDKINILYAQIHHAAKTYGIDKTPITFEFYDDRGDILNGLKSFFSVNLELIPQQVMFCLIRYDGKNLVPITRMQGTGTVDKNPQETISSTDFTKRIDEAEKLLNDRFCWKRNTEASFFRARGSLEAPPPPTPPPATPPPATPPPATPALARQSFFNNLYQGFITAIDDMFAMK